MLINISNRVMLGTMPCVNRHCHGVCTCQQRIENKLYFLQHSDSGGFPQAFVADDIHRQKQNQWRKPPLDLPPGEGEF